MKARRALDNTFDEALPAKPGKERRFIVGCAKTHGDEAPNQQEGHHDQ